MRKIFFIYFILCSCTVMGTEKQNLLEESDVMRYKGFHSNQTITNDDEENAMPYIPLNDVVRNADQLAVQSKQDVLNWLIKDIIPIRSSGAIKNLAMGGVELYMSLARGAVYGAVGYNLALTSFNADTVGAIFYGTAVGIPMALLGSVSSRKFISNVNESYEKYCRNRRGFEKIIEKPFTERAPKLFAKLICIGTPALISSAMITNLSREEFMPVLGNSWWVIGAANLFTRTLLDYESIPIVYKKIRDISYIKSIADKIEPYLCISQERRQLEEDVTNQLLKSKNYIEYSCQPREQKAPILDDDALDALLGEMKHNTIEPNEKNLKKYLFRGTQAIQEESTAEMRAGLIMGAVTLAGAWVYYTLTADFFRYLLSDSHMDNEALSIWSNVLATISLTSASAVNAIAGYKIGKTGWSSLRKINYYDYKTCLSGFLYFSLAACTASTSYNIYYVWPIENKIAAMFVLTTSMTSLFSMAAWAVDGATKKYPFKINKASPLLDKVDRIIDKIPSMTNHHLQSLKNILEDITH